MWVKEFLHSEMVINATGVLVKLRNLIRGEPTEASVPSYMNLTWVIQFNPFGNHEPLPLQESQLCVLVMACGCPISTQLFNFLEGCPGPPEFLLRWTQGVFHR